MSRLLDITHELLGRKIAVATGSGNIFGSTEEVDSLADAASSSELGGGGALGVGGLLAAALAGGLAYRAGGKGLKFLGGLHPWQRLGKNIKLFKPMQKYQADLAGKAFKNPKQQLAALEDVIKEGRKVEGKYLTSDALQGWEREASNLREVAKDPMHMMKSWIPDTPGKALVGLGLTGTALKAPDILSSILGGGDKRRGLTIS